MKTREFDSVFLKAEKCKECAWVDFPVELRFIGFGLLKPPYEVCPKCGGKITVEIGKFRVKETSSFFGGKQREIISFTPRATS